MIVSLAATGWLVGSRAGPVRMREEEVEPREEWEEAARTLPQLPTLAHLVTTNAQYKAYRIG